MEGFLTLLRFSCLMASNFGYYNLLRKKTDLDISFIPVITIGIQVTALLLAGILNLLLPAAVIMLTAGLVLFAFDLIHGRTREYKSFAAAPYIYMGVCFLTLVFVLYKSWFYCFDDFSHWATAVQELLASNQFPNYSCRMIHFKTYPLGSTVYIYYCCLIAGTEEWIQMLIQSCMIICGLLPLFSCCRKHKLWLLIFLAFFTNFVLVYNVPLACLLVDTLLPVIGMSAALITWNIYGKCCRKESSSKELWLVAPVLVMAAMIKNPGIFFVIPSVIILAAIWKKKPETKLDCAGIILAPAAALVIWRQHCAYVFPDMLHSKHTISIESYAEELSRKSTEEIIEIAREMLDFFLNHRAILYILTVLAAIIAVNYLFNKNKLRQSIVFACFIISGYIAYMAGLYGMYIFSMPIDEAIILNDVSRYVAAMDIAVFYLIVSFALSELDEANIKKHFIMVAVFMALILAWGNLAHWDIISGNEKTQIRVNLDAIVDAYNIPLGTPCVVCNSKFTLEGYMQNLVSYTLWSYLVCPEDAFEGKNLVNLNNMEYILMMDYENKEINHWIQEHYPEQYGSVLIVTSLTTDINK